MKNLLVFLFLLLIVNIFSFSNKEMKIPEKNGQNIIHFINCGSSDAILLEANGHFGLIDSSNPYQYIQNEVEHVQIDESIGEVNQWVSDPDKSIQAVINYLNYLQIDKLDFIIGTHAHSDHIGGIPAIAYYFVNENTKYYYREYRKTREDTSNVDWANYKYYLAAIHSMEKKGAYLIDVTDQKIQFDFGDMNLELLNTDIDPDELNLGENQNSIVTFIKFRNTKILLTADMIAKDDQILKDYVGKIDILKLAHHGYSESSYEFLKVTKPNYVIIFNDHIANYANQIINYLKYNLYSKIYMTGYISKSSESIPNSAIKLNLNLEGQEFEFINTGKEVEPDSSMEGWSSWNDKWTYLELGKTVKGWRNLEWSQGKDWFYFNEDGIMLVGWQELEYLAEKKWFYFDKINGNMLTGWQHLEWSGGINWFYFYPITGYMAQDCCVTIDDKEYCFDKNGCLIE